uniref:Uncharacterized protein n=1 Tax=Arundo donax TaxID=35708 RepID=A0A0A9HEL8_ARUDO
MSAAAEILGSGSRGSPEKRCTEVDQAAARVGVARPAGAKVRSVTGNSEPETSSEERKARQ